jgi:hypothetical protein
LLLLSALVETGAGTGSGAAISCFFGSFNKANNSGLAIFTTELFLERRVPVFIVNYSLYCSS